MDIKLRARLSAYSRIESITQVSNNTPTPDVNSAGSLVGVNKDGEYTLYKTVGKEEIDSLFMDVVPDDVVSKEEIDSLFSANGESSHVPVTPQAPASGNNVTFEDIDSLFK